MKTFYLPALLWALALSQTFAQKQLAPSAAAHVANWTGNVKNLLQEAGFETSYLKYRPQNPESVQNRSELQLDSTILFFDYDPTGSLDSTPLFRTVHTHFPQMNTEVVVEDQFDAGIWNPAFRTTTIKDEKDRTVGIAAAYFDLASNAWVPDSRIEIFPRGSSLELEDSVFVDAWSIDLNDWVRLMTIHNQFDAAERLKLSITTIDFAGQSLQFKDLYTYDSNGDNTIIESFLVDSSGDIPGGYQELTYENHLVTSITIFNGDWQSGMIPQDRITFNYNASWHVETTRTYVWDIDQNEWLEVLGEDYGYDNQNRLVEIVTANFGENNENYIERITYAYREAEYIHLESNYYFDFDLDEFVLIDRKYYYYSGDTVSETPHEPVSVKPLVVSPNPASGTLRIQLTEAANVQVFDLNGRLVQQVKLQPGQMMLELHNLPAGIYQLKAVTAGGNYAGRLVKQ